MLDLLDEKLFTNKVFDFTLNEEQWVNRNLKPCCVFVFTDWCTYCHEIHATLKQLSDKYKDAILFYRVNGDDNPHLSQRLKIISVPVIVFVPLKGEPQLLKGLFSDNMIEFIIKDILL